MNTEMVTRIIQLIIAPVVMITACALILNGLLGRYAAVNDRLRLMARERLDLLRTTRQNAASGDADAFTAERLTAVDHQLPELLRHHRQLHDSVSLVYGAVLVFVADMFVIAAAAAGDSGALATLALVVFLVGMGVLFASIGLALIEIRNSHRAVHYEVRRAAELGG